MRLISLYIENFGNLSAYKYNFDSNLSSFYEENGYGKTTLVSFIKAMFYGLENYYSTSKFNERIRFFPFNNNKFGGNIEFEHEGNAYRIERTFSRHSANYDVLVVYKNNQRSRELEKIYSLGTYFFGIDKTSFERIFFITSDEIDIKSTSSISSKLGMTIYGGEEKFDLDSAIKLLEEKGKKYRNKRGLGNGYINKAKERMYEIEIQIRNLEQIKKNISIKYNKLKNIENERNEIYSKINSWEEAFKLNELNKKYQDFLNTKKADEVKLQNIKNNYLNGLPLQNEIIEVITKKDVNDKLSNQVFSLDEEKSKLYKKHKETLINEDIKNEDIDNLTKTISEVKKIKGTNELINKNLTDLKEKNKDLDAKYKDDPKVEENLKKVQEYISTINSDDFKNSPPLNFKNKKITSLFLAILSFILLISGLVTIFFNLIAGLIIAIVGVLLSITTIVFINKIKKKSEDYTKQKSKTLNGEIKEILVKYNFYNEKNILNSLILFSNEATNYLNYIKQQNDYLVLIRKNNEEINKFEISIISILRKYYLESNNENYEILFNNLKEYLALFKEQETLNNLNKTNEEQIKENQASINNILNKYHISLDKIEEVKNDINDFNSLTTQIKNEEQNILNFYKENEEQLEKFKLKEELIKEIISKDFTYLNKEKEDIDKDYNLLEKEIIQDEDEISRLGELEYQLNEVSNRKKQYIKNYDLITATIENLKEADRNLNSKYLMPLVNNFTKYANLIEKTLSTKLRMNSNLEITFDIAGDLRSDKHLSSGNKAICELCFRLALIENMYKDEKPFVLLDDPFVQLDEKHLINAIEIIKEISNNIQVIYLTCHQSRKI